ncbi:hypothetical protein WJX82_003595 [Trebouxia sp. C0006]
MHQLQLGSLGLIGSLPAEWASPTAWPCLLYLGIVNASITGTIPAAWEQAESCNFTGTLPARWGSMGVLPQTVYSFPDTDTTDWESAGILGAEWISALPGCPLVGILPSTWGTPGAFPSLSTLILACSCSGALPSTWGSPASFPQLQVLAVTAPNLTGTLPSNWSEAGAYPFRTSLQLTAPLAGPLPASWGSNGSFPALTSLKLVGGMFLYWSPATNLGEPCKLPTAPDP